MQNPWRASESQSKGHPRQKNASRAIDRIVQGLFDFGGQKKRVGGDLRVELAVETVAVFANVRLGIKHRWSNVLRLAIPKLNETCEPAFPMEISPAHPQKKHP